MARVTHVEHARKAQDPCTKCGVAIQAGDTYRWWKFRFGPKHVRCGKPDCAPRASDLTQSDFYSTLFDLGDRLQAALEDFRNGGIADDLSSELTDIASDLRSLGEECQEKYDNMPDGLQQGDTGQLLQTRAEECESKADELESAASTLNSFDPDEEDQEQARESAVSEADIDMSID